MIKNSNCLIIGIGGATNSGKTTLSTRLLNSFPGSTLITMDDYYLPEDHSNHVIDKELNHANWELPSAVDFDHLIYDFQQKKSNLCKTNLKSQADYKNGNTDMNAEHETDVKIYSNSDIPIITEHVRIKKSECGNKFSSISNFDKENCMNYNETSRIQLPLNTESFTDTLEFNTSKSLCLPTLLIVEGILIYYDLRLLDSIKTRFFLTLSREVCKKRRETRSYDPPDPPSYFDRIVWPEYEKQLEHSQGIPGLIYISGEQKEEDIYRYVYENIMSEISREQS